MAAKPKYERKCRECGTRRYVGSVIARCPDCGADYGPFALGMDRDMGVVKAMDADIQAVADASYRAFLDEKPKRRVIADDAPEPTS